MAREIKDWFDSLEQDAVKECSKLMDSIQPAVTQKLIESKYSDLVTDYLRVSKYLKACESLKESLEKRLKESPDHDEVKLALNTIEKLCEKLERTINLLPDEDLSPLKGGKMVDDSVLSEAFKGYSAFKNSNGYKEVFSTNTKETLKGYMKLSVQTLSKNLKQ